MNRLVARWVVRQAALRLAKTIDKTTTDRWRKDLRVMTKIYKGLEVVSYGDDESKVREATAAWESTRKLFRNFRNNLEEWAYKELLPKATSDRTETYMEKTIRASVWDLRYQLDDATLFPPLRPGRDPDWSKFRNERDRTLKRYQKSAVKAFKEIDEYLETKPEAKLERRPVADHMEVGGAQVILLNWGRDDESSGEHEVEPYLRGLREKIDQIKRAGFGVAVKGLTVTVDFDQAEWDTTGRYRPNTDELIIYPMGLIGESGAHGHGTFTHEVGHRFYFKNLSASARQRWDAVLEERGVKITADDISRFSQVIVHQLRGHESDRAALAKLTGEDDVFRAVQPHIKDEADEVKFRELSKLPIKPLSAEVFDPIAFAKFLSSKEGETVQLEEITDYANTSPMEAFAEVFRLWVKKGPGRLGPWMREFFPGICRSGGAKLASTTAAGVAKRYLAQRQINADYAKLGLLNVVDERRDATCFLNWVRTGGGDPFARAQTKDRVLSRYLDGQRAAKAKAKGLSLLPDYRKALEKLEKGETESMNEFALKVRKIVEDRPDWLSALSTQKMNAVRALYRGVQEYQLYSSSIQTPILGERIVQDVAGWAKWVRTMELASAIGDTVLEIQRGPFTVVPIPGVTAAQTEGALEALDAAVAKIHPKCPKVLYGKVFLSTHLKKGVAAWYDGNADNLSLNVEAKKRFNDIFTIIHELGHRHDYKGFLSNQGRINYWNLSTQKQYEKIHFDSRLREQMADEVVALTKLRATGKPVTGMSDMLELWLQSAHPHSQGDVRTLTKAFIDGKIDEKKLHDAIKGKRDEDVSTGKVIREPLYVTPYGKTGGPKENYADGFAHFILGMDMPAELAAILAEELA